mmetsp:Transcript_14330/g.26899  ORF Transcript_14330/g.26899 Transcript_14330/m.26899 type:complete len:311 (+) Transcript_14330:179-1111(+)
MKTLAMLVFFVSPLASIFRLGILLYDHFSTSSQDDSVLIQNGNGHSYSDENNKELPLFLKMLQNATSIDDMVQAILSSSSLPLKQLAEVLSPPSPLSIMLGTASSTITNTNLIQHNNMMASTLKSTSTNPYVQMHVLHTDLQAVIPFLFVSFILIWIPLVLFFIPWCGWGWGNMAEYQNYPGRRSRRRVNARKQREMNRKIQLLLSGLEQCRMVVASNEESQDQDDSHHTNPQLPRISCIATSSNGTCAICLSNYQEDQIVVQSPNGPCTHLFHFECMKQWIEKRAAGDCPCCRRNFVQIEPMTAANNDK